MKKIYLAVVFSILISVYFFSNLNNSHLEIKTDKFSEENSTTDIYRYIIFDNCDSAQKTFLSDYYASIRWYKE